MRAAVCTPGSSSIRVATPQPVPESKLLAQMLHDVVGPPSDCPHTATAWPLAPTKRRTFPASYGCSSIGPGVPQPSSGTNRLAQMLHAAPPHCVPTATPRPEASTPTCGLARTPARVSTRVGGPHPAPRTKRLDQTSCPCAQTASALPAASTSTYGASASGQPPGHTWLA